GVREGEPADVQAPAARAAGFCRSGAGPRVRPRPRARACAVAQLPADVDAAAHVLPQAAGAVAVRLRVAGHRRPAGRDPPLRWRAAAAASPVLPAGAEAAAVARREVPLG